MRPASRMTEKIAAERLVFVDECGTHTSLTLLYGHAPGDERLRLSGPRKGQEHHFALDYEYGGVRIISDSGRSDHCFGLRGLRIESALAPSLRICWPTLWTPRTIKYLVSAF